MKTFLFTAKEPPIASECPEKYFVADENDISNPIVKGLRYSGVPQVLSRKVYILFFFANFTILDKWVKFHDESLTEYNKYHFNYNSEIYDIMPFESFYKFKDLKIIFKI